MENLKIANLMELELIFMLMDVNIKDNGLMI